jgi:hypothetical protein
MRTRFLRSAPKGKVMTDYSEWDQWYADYLAAEACFWASFRSGVRAKPPQPAEDALRRIAAPQPVDILWLTEALADEVRRWFVSRVARGSGEMDEALVRPMLDAAINEVDPSWNRWFVEPCITAVGYRRVNEYLLDVVASGTDFQKAGAVNALYWAGVHLVFRGDARTFDYRDATPESRAEYEALSDVWQRERELFLETFVSNQNVDVRRAIIGKLDLEPAHYREHLRPVVTHAIDIARSSDDDYIRHRVEVQLGNELLLRALPHRESDRTQAE